MTDYYSTTLDSYNLTIMHRYAISYGIKNKDSITTIASNLGFSRQTIHKEIKRGTVELLRSDYTTWVGYDPERAQNYYEQSVAKRGRSHKLSMYQEVKEYIESKLKSGYSPEAIEFFLKKENKECIVTSKTIYNSLDDGLFNVSNEVLYYGKRKRNKGKFKKEKLRLKPNGGESIELRENINDRLEFGHWEIDSVVGKREGKSTSLMTLVERKTRFGIVIKIPKKNKKSIVNALKKLKILFGKYFYDIFKSITADNGSEFKDAIGMSCILKNGKKIKIYFAHAYSSYERGTNENYNRFIRRYFKKGTDFTRITTDDIFEKIRFINNYPRKKLNFKSSRELFILELNKIIDSKHEINYIIDRL